MVDLSTAWKSEKGRRSANEDSCLVLTGEELGGQADGLFIVADGMGGRASGAVASSLAVNAVRDTFKSGLGSGDIEGALAESLQAANRSVFQQASAKPELQGMGTTCVAAAIKDDRVYFAHLGDSRMYLLRDGRLRSLTEDHSFVAEKLRTGEITEDQARRSRFRNVITRAVGLESDAQPSLGSTELDAGDIILLCTDGLTTAVSDSQIADILSGASSSDEACDNLVRTALKNGSSDNITVIVSAYGTSKRRSTARVRRTSWALPAILSLIIGLAAGLFAGWRWLPDLTEPLTEVVSTEIRPNFAGLTYEDPVSLLHNPLRDGLALDGQGLLHVIDHQGRLLRVDGSGRILFTFPMQIAGKVALDGEGNLYISDPIGKRVMKYSPSGFPLGNIGEGKLSAPGALVVDGEGSVYVIDSGRLKVIRPKVDLNNEPEE